MDCSLLGRRRARGWDSWWAGRGPLGEQGNGFEEVLVEGLAVVGFCFRACSRA